MKSFAWLAAAIFLSFSLISGNAEAKRLGGGSSSGMQRSTSSYSYQKPAGQPAVAPTTAGNPAAAAGAPKRSWGGALAGLAAGLGLAALASYLGFGEGMASLMLIALLAIAAFAVIGFVLRRRAPAQPALAGAGIGNPRPDASWRTAEINEGGQSAAARSGVAGFDAAAFEREAKVNFIRLQAANDRGDLEDIRTFTTPEMFGEIRLALLERKGEAQQTDVVTLDSQVVDVVEEGARYVVSIRFSGMIREQAGAAALPFDEVWHMVKPVDGSGGWLLAGIQQLQ